MQRKADQKRQMTQEELKEMTEIRTLKNGLNQF